MSENDDDQMLFCIRHSLSHVMAQAVLEIFPEGKIAIGPAIENGFYYDFDLPRFLTPEDLTKIENRMREIVQGRHNFIYREVSANEARSQFQDQPYKLELINDLERGGKDEYGNPSTEPVKISFYSHDTFTDLCRGPHIKNTSQINPDAFKLLNIAGAYWRGDEKRPMVQRIYGTAWRDRQGCDAYIKKLEELEARDHRRINKQLDLFTIPEEIGGGLIIYGPKAGRIRAIIEEFWRLMILPIECRRRSGKHNFRKSRTC